MCRLRWHAIAVFSTVAAIAQQLPDVRPAWPEGVYRPGGDIRAPVVAARPLPGYTAEARLAKLEGGVLLSLIAGKDGRAREIRVERSLGLGLDESAAENVRGWRFQPGTKNGNPVDVLVSVEVFFRQPRKLWDWHLVGAAFEAPDASRPLVIQVRYPPTSETEENAAVSLALEVDASGAARSVRVERSSDSRWESEIVTAVQDGWRFKPGMKNGKPAAARARLDFVRGSHSPIPLEPLGASRSAP